jgi:hypothetical protein
MGVVGRMTTVFRPDMAVYNDATDSVGQIIDASVKRDPTNRPVTREVRTSGNRVDDAALSVAYVKASPAVS